jgi:hypothetical protein
MKCIRNLLRSLLGTFLEHSFLKYIPPTLLSTYAPTPTCLYYYLLPPPGPLATLPLSLPLSSLYSITHELISCLLTLPLFTSLFSSLLFSSQKLNLLLNSTPLNVLVIELDILAKKERKEESKTEGKKERNEVHY